MIIESNKKKTFKKVWYRTLMGVIFFNFSRFADSQVGAVIIRQPKFLPTTKQLKLKTTTPTKFNNNNIIIKK